MDIQYKLLGNGANVRWRGLNLIEDAAMRIEQALYFNEEITLQETATPLQGDYAFISADCLVLQIAPADQPPYTNKSWRKYIIGTGKELVLNTRLERQNDNHDYAAGPKQLALCDSPAHAGYIAYVLNLEYDHC